MGERFLVLALLCQISAAWGVEFHDVYLPGKGDLGVINGGVWVVDGRSASFGWSLPGSMDVGWIRVELPSDDRGRYLAYTLSEEGGGVIFLSSGGPRPKAGTKWSFHRAGDKPERYAIRAAEGAFKGWYLCVEEKAHTVKVGGGKTVTGYRLYLDEKPKKVPYFRVTQISG